MLTGCVVVDNEQYVGIALGAAGELGKRRHVVVPHGARRHGSEQLGQVVGRLFEILLQSLAQLALLLLESLAEGGTQALASLVGERTQAAGHFLPGQLEVAGQALGIAPQPHTQLIDQGIHRAPGQGNSHHHLHQQGQPQGDEDRTQQTTLQEGEDG
ncbi:hypothetical protein D3C85_636800 [compost metagenome]